MNDFDVAILVVLVGLALHNTIQLVCSILYPVPTKAEQFVTQCQHELANLSASFKHGR